MRTPMVILLGVLGGCGDDGQAQMIDAAVPIDMPPDMPPAPLDAPPAPAGHYYFVVDWLKIPTTNPEARAFGVDLNGDTTVDNQLGMVFAILGNMGIDVVAENIRAVDRGSLITLVDVATDSFTTDPTATLALFDGSNPSPAACSDSTDPVCRHQFAGNGSFTAVATPVNPALAGAFVNSELLAGPGALAVEIAFPVDVVTRINLIGARVKLTTGTPTELGNLVIAGGISEAEIQANLIPGFRSGAMAAVTRDCTALTSPPTCGCPAGTDGKSMIDLYDGGNSTPRDCMISVAEIQNNALIQALLAPDVSINGVNALSFGASTHAVPAMYAAP